jgi:hypothetical protein
MTPVNLSSGFINVGSIIKSLSPEMESRILSNFRSDIWRRAPSLFSIEISILKAIFIISITVNQTSSLVVCN